jgi:SAM-dependent methyltransferase
MARGKGRAASTLLRGTSHSGAFGDPAAIPSRWAVQLAPVVGPEDIDLSTMVKRWSSWGSIALTIVMIGAARNLPFYSDAVEEVVGVDASPEMLALAERSAVAQRPKVRFLARSGESLPFEHRSFDVALVTWSLCSIADPITALKEARRVLKADGELRFVEHGLSPDADVRNGKIGSRLCGAVVPAAVT